MRGVRKENLPTQPSLKLTAAFRSSAFRAEPRHTCHNPRAAPIRAVGVKPLEQQGELVAEADEEDQVNKQPRGQIRGER